MRQFILTSPKPKTKFDTSKRLTAGCDDWCTGGCFTTCAGLCNAGSGG